MRLLPLVLAALACLALTSRAEPLTPASDDEIVETLPTVGAFAAEQRRLRRQLAGQPRDAATALALSRATLAQARDSGDARLAGQALGVLKAWDGDARAPLEIRLQRATLLQHLHDFDGALGELEAVLREAPRQPQALLTLATVHRVQGRYAESDAACARLAEAGQPLYAAACAAENQALRGEFDAARRELATLAAARPGDAGWTAWITTTLGELELRAGRLDAALDALRAAHRLGRDGYSRLALADALIEARRWQEADALLAGDADASDAVLLRRAIVARAQGSADAAALQRTLAARHAQAALRPEAAAVHARERARFALEVEGDAARALELARANVATQREAVDVLLLHRAAQAAGDAAARGEAAALATRIGLRDRRLDAAPAGAAS